MVKFTVVDASDSDGFDADVCWCFLGGRLSEYVLCRLCCV